MIFDGKVATVLLLFPPLILAHERDICTNDRQPDFWGTRDR